MSDSTLRGSRNRPPSAPPEATWRGKLRSVGAAIGVAVVVVSVAVLAYWQFYSSRHAGFLRPGTVECRALYDAARSASDTSRVDLTHPALASQRDPNIPTCGTLRQMG